MTDTWNTSEAAQLKLDRVEAFRVLSISYMESSISAYETAEAARARGDYPDMLIWNDRGDAAAKHAQECRDRAAAL